MWFERLTGFPEISPRQVRANLVHEGRTLTSLASGVTWHCGELEIPSLAALRERARNVSRRPTTLRSVVADVRDLHRDPANAGALFQVASQFNLLEMASPEVSPEEGVSLYTGDNTQGPACAVACGAGTIVRNYFVEVDGRVGQTEGKQIDCLADLGTELGNEDDRHWNMTNGYVLARRDGLEVIAARLADADEAERDRLRGLLRIGLQKETEVTLAGTGHRVHQAYCSALPVAYGDAAAQLWEPFARLVLEAAYEATLVAAGILDAPRVYLTLLGGGVFGNARPWILAALERALERRRGSGLDVVLVSHGGVGEDVLELVGRWDG